MTSAPSSPIPLNRRRLIAAGAAGLAALAPAAAWALDRPKLSRQANHALSQLYANDSTARALGAQALAVLVFPEITKAGFIVGGENGDGVLYLGRSVAGFYSITAGSIGLQAGAQKYGYALFFMNQKALDYLRRSDGWSIGTGPTVVIVD
jgi:lipid-binding SYLF domain-containing protein